MKFPTLTDVKTILGITDNSKDALITYLLPIVRDKFHGYTKNYFLNYWQQYTSARLRFVSATSKIEIIDTGSIYNFNSVGLTKGFYKITGSANNDGTLEVIEVSDYYLKVSNEKLLNDENTTVNGNYVIITKIHYPDGLAIPVANYINAIISDKTGGLIQSESLPGGYSVTYRDFDNLLELYFKEYRLPMI